MFKKNILFVCTGNSCRSVMASYYLKKLVRDKEDIKIDSAGISAIEGLPASGNTLEVLMKEGIDAARHVTKSVTTDMIRDADFIFAMHEFHKDKILDMAPEAWDKVYLLGSFGKALPIEINVPDPIGKSLEFYEATFEMIKEAVNRIANIIIDENEEDYAL